MAPVLSYLERVFDFSGERVRFRSPGAEAFTLILLMLLAFLLLFLGVALGVDMAPFPRLLVPFLAVATLVPAVAFFWGTPAGMAVAIFQGVITLFLSIIWLRSASTTGWFFLLTLALCETALRIGAAREFLDGDLYSHLVKYTDLIEEKNEIETNIASLETRIGATRERGERLLKLIHSTSRLEEKLSPRQVAEELARQVRGILGRGRCLIYRFIGKGGDLLASYPPLPEEFSPFGDDFNPLIAQRRENIFLSDVAKAYHIHPVAPQERPFRTLLMTPLSAGYEVWGVLRVEDEEPTAFDREDLMTLSALSVPGALILQNAELFSQIEKLALIDGLTGTFRRHHFEERLRAELARARREQGTLSLVLIDLDRFKSINDTFGHLEGDRVLKTVGKILNENVSSPGLVARYGGEEFVLLLPGISKESAAAATDAIRKKLEAIPFPEFNRSITFSAGVASFPADGATLETLTNTADQALYKAKSAGRNRVVTA
ncbi:MAG: GGDEF domain-containing protein [Candidatus Hydrogenedentota bacterium]|nr:MAG: GGDEF domain-containing protein [Candidatus Hydrogenedentota bacterium]